MRYGEHWNDYPPDDPPQCDHNGDYCQCEPPDEVRVESEKQEDEQIRRTFNEPIDTNA